MTTGVTVLCDRFPELSETFIAQEVAGLQAAGLRVRVEALAHPDRPGAGPGVEVACLEDDTTASRLSAVVMLALRHPIACLRDVAARRRWRRQEPVLPLRALAPLARRIARSGDDHIHSHFARAAALSAMRLGRLLGLPYSVTAHAYDIYQSPANLPEKLTAAAFSTSGCDYTVATLRELAGPAHAARVHKIIMGVDGRAFRRDRLPPGKRRVIGVGRLVEKKGFADLLRAAAILRDAGAPLDAVVVVGDGPLRGELTADASRLSLDGVVQLVGERSHEEVRTLLEASDVFCLPCVVASDGDRDSMPVAVKEALAMELPVVGTSEVGLPEVVRPEWGTLVPPHDPGALADALLAELARPPAERAARGAAGRAFVLEHCDSRREAARLAELIRGGG